MNKRVILLDMDGTLLGRSQVAVSEKNMRALQRVIDAGHIVVPCTGRVLNMMPPQLLSERGIRYLITCHGARVVDRQAGTSLYENIISPVRSAAVLSLVEGKNLYAEIAASNTIYLERAVADTLKNQPVPIHHLWYMIDQCYTAVEKPSEFFLQHGIGIEKINVYGVPEPMQKELYDALTATGFIAHTRPGAGRDLEFLTNTLDKVEAAQTLLDKLQMGWEDVIALGDSSSDTAILKKSGLGIAMGNAPQAIRALADDVTGANVDDGVALALDKYLS